MSDGTQTSCQIMVSLNLPTLGIYGQPQVKCGAPIPRGSCPFGTVGCPNRSDTKATP